MTQHYCSELLSIIDVSRDCLSSPKIRCVFHHMLALLGERNQIHSEKQVQLLDLFQRRSYNDEDRLKLLCTNAQTIHTELQFTMPSLKLMPVPLFIQRSAERDSCHHTGVKSKPYPAKLEDSSIALVFCSCQLFTNPY